MARSSGEPARTAVTPFRLLTDAVTNPYVAIVGIFVAYLYYGILQEELYRPAADGSKFEYSSFLLFIMCLCNIIVAMFGLLVTDGGTDGFLRRCFFFRNSLTHKSLPEKEATAKASANREWMVRVAVCGVTYVLAMLCSNMSLMYVSYPMQALGKSCKLVPVMLGTILIGKASYSLREVSWRGAGGGGGEREREREREREVGGGGETREMKRDSRLASPLTATATTRRRQYSAVGLVIAGILTYRMAKIYAKHGTINLFGDDDSEEGQNLGLLLLFGSLCLDGLTTGNQSKLRKGCGNHKPKAHELMFWTNFWGLVTLIVNLAYTGEYRDALAYTNTHKEKMSQMLWFGVCSGLGQNFIFATVTG